MRAGYCCAVDEGCYTLWGIKTHFVANLSKTLHINFYQNRSSIVEVTIKNFGVFLCPTV